MESEYTEEKLDQKNSLVKIEISYNDFYTVVHITGSLNLTTEKDLRQQISSLIENNQTNLVLDFSQVTFMDSSGMSSILSVMRSIAEINGRLCLVCDTRYILRILHITAIDRLVPIYHTLEEAILSFSSREDNCPKKDN